MSFAQKGNTDKGAVAFIWDQFGPYHMDRVSALAQSLPPGMPLLGLEVSSRSDLYQWERTGVSDQFEKITFFPDRKFEETGAWERFQHLRRIILRRNIQHLFLVPYWRPDIVGAALLMRLLRRRVYTMAVSKFDDKYRNLIKEMVKVPLFWPYHGAIAGSSRTIEYLRFLGFGRKPILPGYDTVGLDRMRSLAIGHAPIDMSERAFVVVARFVPKKNLDRLLDAYAIYLEQAGEQARDLRLCGAGPLEQSLQEQAERLNISKKVHFLGFLDASGVASELSRAFCLLLPSLEEQFGLVVNEALAFGLPILISDNAGARDYLVRNWVNGFVLEPHNIQGWAEAMFALSTDTALWHRFSDASTRMAPMADTPIFAEACLALMGSQTPAADSLLTELLQAHERPSDLGL